MKIVTSLKVYRLILVAALSASLGFGNVFANQHSYLIDLNSKTATEVGIGTDNDPHGINDAGQVVGWRSAHAFITGPNGAGMRDLDTLGGTGGYASGVNDAGQVVGSFYTAEGSRHAFMSGPNGMDIKDLGTLAGNSISEASGINGAGQVVGDSYNYDETYFLPRFYHRSKWSGHERSWQSRGWL